MAIPTVGTLILKNNKVLLVRHEAGSGYTTHIYGLPSGRFQPQETEKQAAARELLEETGLIAQEDDLQEFPGNFYISKLPNRKDPTERKKIYTWRVFLCQTYKGGLKNSQETSPLWIEVGQLDSLDLLPNIKNAVEAGLKFVKK